MANPIYAKLLEQYEQKRRTAERNANRFRRDTYAAHPELAELDRQMSLEAAEYSVRIINGEDVKAQMHQRLSALADKKKRLLLALGLTPDDFEPKYQCKKCNDTGLVSNGYCTCFKARVIEENFKCSNLSNSLETQSFENFSLSYYSNEKTERYPLSPRENMEHTLASCKAFTNTFEQPGKSLLMLGKTGLGKTYLSTCIARVLLTRGHSVIYISAVDFFKRVEKSRFDSTDTDIRMFEDCDLLIIDDLGTEAPSVYTVAVFSDILDRRLRNGKKMIFSSNNRFLDFEKLYGERVFSRLAGGFDCLLFYGKDIRVQKFMNGEDR